VTTVLAAIVGVFVGAGVYTLSYGNGTPAPLAFAFSVVAGFLVGRFLRSRAEDRARRDHARRDGRAASSEEDVT
jgi:hypothetical protein